MSSLLRPGKVAVSFKVDRERSAGGWVHPGDTIAVFQKQPCPLHRAAKGGKRICF